MIHLLGRQLWAFFCTFTAMSHGLCPLPTCGDVESVVPHQASALPWQREHLTCTGRRDSKAWWLMAIKWGFDQFKPMEIWGFSSPKHGFLPIFWK
jgi:hypothetical protein